MRKRMRAVYVLLLLLFSGVVWRLYNLTQSGVWSATEQQSTITLTVANGRATIYDRNLQKMVNKDVSFQSCIAPFPTTLTELSEKLPTEQWERLSQRLAQGRPITTELSKLYAPIQGLWQYITPIRYSNNQLAPHLIGYLNSEGTHGVTGIEEVMDTYLSDKAGNVTLTFEVDANGRVIEGIQPTVSNTLKNTDAGVVLTIDSTIQHITETVAAQYMKKGAVVILEPSSGRVLSMVSMPTYQPTAVDVALEQDDAPLLNRALCNYNCGSVFKIVTAAAALESGVSADKSFTCTGSVTIGDVTIACHNKIGHGTLTMKEAFAQSCNPYFIRLAQEIGADALYEQAAALGFTDAVRLAEGYQSACAVLPSLFDLTIPAELANVSIGQGGLLATPLHIAQMVSAVKNNGEWIPATVIQGYVDETGVYTEEPLSLPTRAFSESTAQTLRDFMRNAMVHGTGTTANPLVGISGGKTGTAETGWVEDGVNVVQSWYTGYFENETRTFAIAIVGEDKNRTGVRAAPLFKALCAELFAVS